MDLDEQQRKAGLDKLIPIPRRARVPEELKQLCVCVCLPPNWPQPGAGSEASITTHSSMSVSL